MTLTEIASAARDQHIAAQNEHRIAIEQHEKAIKHHRQAVWLHDSGDLRQADSHANIAYNHAQNALATGAKAIQKDQW